MHDTPRPAASTGSAAAGPTPPPAIAAALEREFRRIVVFSGAGISAESGIPTFRSGDDGLWREFDPTQLATPNAFSRDPELVWGWYEWRRGLIQQAQPNAGHRAAARLQHSLGAFVITQNVDDLHERGGASEVLHLHGSLLAARCFACARPFPLSMPPPEARLRLPPPRCEHCNGLVRPGVVWFGEDLSVSVVREVEAAVRACDLLLVVGTSGKVYPAAGMVDLAPMDATVIVINPDAKAGQGPGRLHWATTAAEALPWIADALAGRDEEAEGRPGG